MTMAAMATTRIPARTNNEDHDDGDDDDNDDYRHSGVQRARVVASSKRTGTVQ